MAYCVIYAMTSNYFRWSFGTHLLSQDEDWELFIPVKTASKTSSKKVTLFNRMMMPIYWSFVPCFTPMGLAGIFGIVAALSPLRLLLVEPKAPLYATIFVAIRGCGYAAVPLMLVLLGAQITTLWTTMNKSLRKSMLGDVIPSDYPSYRWANIWVIANRLVLLPLLSAIVLQFVIPVLNFHLLLDPMFIISILLMASMPTSTDLWIISEKLGNFERQMAKILVWQHLLFLPMSLIWCFVYICVTLANKS